MSNYICPNRDHGTKHTVEAAPGTPEQRFCGRWYHCAICGPQGGSTLIPSAGLAAQLASTPSPKPQ